MEHTTLFIDEHDFHGLKFLCEFSCGNVCIDIQNLPVVALGKTAQDGQGASTDRGFNGPFVDSRHLADQTILVGIESGSRENTGGDRTGTRTELLECTNQFQIFLEENTTGDLEGLCVYEAGRAKEVYIGMLDRSI